MANRGHASHKEKPKKCGSTCSQLLHSHLIVLFRDASERILWVNSRFKMLTQETDYYGPTSIPPISAGKLDGSFASAESPLNRNQHCVLKWQELCFSTSVKDLLSIYWNLLSTINSQDSPKWWIGQIWH